VKHVRNTKEEIVVGINVVLNKVLESKLFEYSMEATRYINGKVIVAINIISEKTFNNKLFVNIQIPDYIKSSMGENVKNLEKFTGEITNKIFHPVKESYQSFILFWENMLGSEIEISK